LGRRKKRGGFYARKLKKKRSRIQGKPNNVLREKSNAVRLRTTGSGNSSRKLGGWSKGKVGRPELGTPLRTHKLGKVQAKKKGNTNPKSIKLNKNNQLKTERF